MNGDIYKKKIKEIKNGYILHLILSAITIVFNFLLLFELYWGSRLLYYLFCSICIFGIMYFLIPIIPFIFILLKKLTHKCIKIFTILSFIFCGLAIISGLGFIVILMFNALKLNEFCHECPFNLPISYINNIYDSYKNNNIKEKDLKDNCKKRRCIFNNKIMESQYPYEYICNYDPTDEFDKIKNKTNRNETINQIECNKIENNINNYNIEKNEIYKFFEMCNSFDEFFICQRINEHTIYYIAEDYKCPRKNYLTYLIFACMLSVIFNLIISFLLWRSEYIKYKNLIKGLTQTNNRRTSNSLNSTQNASKIKKEEQEASFKKEPTEIIFVYTNTEENMINEENTSYDNEDINYKNNIKENIKNINIDNKPKINKNNRIITNNIVINNNIKINNIIINNNIINNNIKINNIKNINNKDDMNQEENNIKILKINKNISKVKENEKNLNSKNEKKINGKNKIKDNKNKLNNKDKDNISNNSRKFSPTSERCILEGNNRIPKV